MCLRRCANTTWSEWCVTQGRCDLDTTTRTLSTLVMVSGTSSTTPPSSMLMSTRWLHSPLRPMSSSTGISSLLILWPFQHCNQVIRRPSIHSSQIHALTFLCFSPLLSAHSLIQHAFIHSRFLYPKVYSLSQYFLSPIHSSQISPSQIQSCTHSGNVRSFNI